MATTISTTIDIEAAPEAVWDVLTDFDSYPRWNPFIDRIQGRLEVGRTLVVHLAPDGGRGMTFKPKVVAVAPGRELRWLGKLGVRGLFDGEHSFQLTDNADGTTRLVHGERFSGVLVALSRRTMKDTEAGFVAFNRALKERVETPTLP
jgi:hypothetical protein